jgi:predicted RecA/RadA family phage recombinase
MLATTVAKGDSIDYTPAADVAAGAIVFLGDIVAIATSALAAGVLGALAVEGVFAFAKDDTSGPVFAQGDPAFWDSANSQAVAVCGAGMRRLGTVVTAAGASDSTVRIKINDDIALPAVLQRRVWEEVAINKTLDAEDVGKVMLVTVDAVVITLPSTAAKMAFVIANGGADGAVGLSVSPAAIDKIMGADLPGVDNKDRINTKATARRLDYVSIFGDAVDGYVVEAERGIWAAEA